MSYFAAILSSSFDATDRLDIGLYDLTSPVSINDFFTSGVIGYWIWDNRRDTRQETKQHAQLTTCCWAPRVKKSICLAVSQQTI